MIGLHLTWADASGMKRFERLVRQLNDGQVRIVGNRVLNRTGDTARTGVRRTLTKQTGLKRAVIVKAVRVKRSDPATLAYTMTSKGGDIALKFFGARETRKGVSAAPFGKRKVFASTFIKGGRFPNRSGIVFRGHVMKRQGPDRVPIHVEQSGVVIPHEMVTGDTAAEFQRVVRTVMPRRMAHELRRLLP